MVLDDFLTPDFQMQIEAQVPVYGNSLKPCVFTLFLLPRRARSAKIDKNQQVFVTF